MRLYRADLALGPSAETFALRMCLRMSGLAVDSFSPDPPDRYAAASPSALAAPSSAATALCLFVHGIDLLDIHAGLEPLVRSWCLEVALTFRDKPYLSLDALYLCPDCTYLFYP